MNAAARALAQGNLANSQAYPFSFNLSRQLLGLILLIVACLGSALTVVYVKNLNRHLFCELQGLEQTRNELQIEANQLQLEQNTWSASSRIQTIAEQQMKMSLPLAKDVVLVTFSQR